MNIVPSYIESPKFIPTSPRIIILPLCIIKPVKAPASPPTMIVPPFMSIPVLAPTLPLQIKSPPLMAAPKQDPAFFSITTFPAIKFSAQDQPTLPLILTVGPSQEPIPK